MPFRRSGRGGEDQQQHLRGVVRQRICFSGNRGMSPLAVVKRNLRVNLLFVGCLHRSFQAIFSDSIVFAINSSHKMQPRGAFFSPLLQAHDRCRALVIFVLSLIYSGVLLEEKYRAHPCVFGWGNTGSRHVVAWRQPPPSSSIDETSGCRLRRATEDGTP